jgi:ABC-type phosphate transport system substrate-binding protein
MKTSTIVHSLVTVGLGLALLALTGATNAQNETSKTHSGVIRSLNLNARTLTVDGSGSVITFSVPTDAEIVVEDKSKNADIDKLMVGDKVEVKYTIDDTNYIAHRVAILGLK